MTTTMRLLGKRRFLPLFVTQLLNAFNDNLYKTAMVLFVVYSVYNDEAAEAQFSAIASGVFIAPFFLLSAIAGQLADMRDKARIIRIVKGAEIAIMLVGAAGLLIAWQDAECGRAATGAAARCVAGAPPALLADLAIPLLLAALLAMGIHSTFFGPIKYAILPQHLHRDEVLSGTGLVEAGTYIAILFGTILAGWIPVEVAAGAIVLTALVGYATARQVPPAPPQGEIEPIDWNPFTSSARLIRATMGNAQVYYAILAISFFWTIGAVLFIQFPPLAKNTLMATKEVASLFLVVFSIGVATGSVAVNRLLKGVVSARYAPASVLAMGAFVVGFYLVSRGWDNSGDLTLLDTAAFLAHEGAPLLMLMLLGIAISGGMFVVPLYAFLTTKVAPDQAARTIAANNIVNSGAMVIGSLLAVGLTALGLPITEQLLLGAAMCLVSAWLARRLHAVEDAPIPAELLD
ncbi:MFS transporter [Qipengyuania sediminis]|uniref:MFS transporter n=1 Tax=Qipengyuania sediminis TaxID=1532023 RepID=UPI00105A62FC|nr:MFS transporter [Qipengyuania sediminis]